jgi:hypothetical protein
VVRTTIEGSLVGYGTPRLVVAAASPHPDATVASFPVSAARFAAEYGADDLCTDDGSTSDRIAIRCITGNDAAITRLVIGKDEGGLAVTVNGTQAIWEPNAFSYHCFELHGLDRKADLEPLRKTWRRADSPCPATTPVKITLRLDDAKVTLLGAGAARDLGSLDLRSPATIHRLVDVNGLEVVATGAQRFIYQLGDRIYFLGQEGRVHAADLPCGGRADFNVLAPRHPEIKESELP